MSKKTTDPASENTGHDASDKSLTKPEQAEEDTDRIERAIAEYERIPESKYTESAFNFGRADVILTGRYGKDIRLKDSDLEWQDWLSLKSWTPLQFVLLLCGVSPIRIREPESDVSENLPDCLAMVYLKANQKGLSSPYEWQQFAEEQCLYLRKPLTNIFMDISKDASGKKAGHEEQAEPQKQSTADSELLKNKPRERQNTWLKVIEKMVQEFVEEHGEMPTEDQAWSRLCTKPPAVYNVTTGIDKGGEDCLKMHGIKPLSRSAFGGRWRRYTGH